MKDDQPCTRGSGCCVTGDTRILTPMGMERIDALYTRSKREPVTILTKIDGQLREVAVREVHTDSEAKELFKVTLDDACFVVLTAYHGLWCDQGRDLPLWCRAETLFEYEHDTRPKVDMRRVKSVERIQSHVPPKLYDLELCEGEGYIANGIRVRAFVRETANAK